MAVTFYFKNTVVVPADNGTYIEGVVGEPRFLNPIYSDSNAADRDIVELLFSGLLEYGPDGSIIGGLANYQISEDGKTYDFFLKDNLRWSDGQPITADDAIYTIKTIQDPAYKSPLRTKWIGVETEKISDSSFRLKLKDPFAKFLEYCTIKIIPQHAWSGTTAENFPLSELNLSPIVSGPYEVAEVVLDKDESVSSIVLVKNPAYLGAKPHLEKITFAFFGDQASLAAAFKRGRVQGFVSTPDIAKNTFSGAVDYAYTLPRYYAIFLNQENNDALADVSVRKALAYAINKQEIIEKALGNRGAVVDSPILPEIYGIAAPATIYNYDPAKAAQLLDENGYKQGEGGVRSKTTSRNPAFQFNKNLTPGSNLNADIKELQKCLVKEVAPDLDTNGNFGEKTTAAVKLFQEKYRADILDPQGVKEATGDVKLATREKLNQVCFPSGDETTALTVNLTVNNQEPFVTIAGIIKVQWAAIGVTVNIDAKDADLERDVAKPRDYESLLYGQALGMIPDLYAFWHSGQKDDPGLNLALYQNENADKLLEEIRQSSDPAIRKEKMAQFQNILTEEEPAIFLCNPSYIYTVSREVKNIKTGVIAGSALRFADIENWYTSTKRIWK